MFTIGATIIHMAWSAYTGNVNGYGDLVWKSDIIYSFLALYVWMIIHICVYTAYNIDFPSRKFTEVSLWLLSTVIATISTMLNINIVTPIFLFTFSNMFLVRIAVILFGATFATMIIGPAGGEAFASPKKKRIKKRKKKL